MCRVEGCDRPSAYKREAICQQHRRQQRAGEPFRPVAPYFRSGEKCAFPPCDTPSKNLGYCKTHYDQQYHGRPMRMITKPYKPVTGRDEDGNKWCSTCETWRAETDFASSKGKADGLQTRCRPCNAAIYRKRASEVRDKMREARLNITRSNFDAMFEAQGSACAICRTTDPGNRYWCVDHDHSCCPESGRSCGRCIRGILCTRCNAGIGHLRDDPATLEAAADVHPPITHQRSRRSLTPHSAPTPTPHIRHKGNQCPGEWGRTT